MGRPQSEIDWVQFEKLVWIPVLSNEHLADILGTSKSTLERKTREKYDQSIDSLRQQKQGPMRQNLFSAMWKNAMNGNVASQIWLSKNIFHWSEKVAHSNSNTEPEKLVIQFGKDDKPVSVEKDPKQESGAV